ncbi:MAG: hypothetical protein BHW55_04990 [Candidatus Melainabacteria bacterium 35_41]|nr:MAG: hypothetical protein BHW55_04990 [Candidatus Melainabacteria bacterium 35_41]
MFTMLDIKVEIKSYIVREGTSLTKVMNALNKKKLITTTYSNIANKINTETITFNEAQYIFDHLGYKITIERK